MNVMENKAINKSVKVPTTEPNQVRKRAMFIQSVNSLDI